LSLVNPVNHVRNRLSGLRNLRLPLDLGGVDFVQVSLSRKERMAKKSRSQSKPEGAASGNGRRAEPRWRAILWWLLLVVAVIPVAFRQVSVSDVWWHAAVGRWLLEHRSLPDLSAFYFSPTDAWALGSDLRWSWLGDIVLYILYAVAGPVGFQVLVVGCVVAALWFLAALAPTSRGPWILLLLVVVCLGTYQLQLVRNSVFSLALYPAILWLGLRREGPPRMSEYGIASAVLVLWSCLHGSCVLGWFTAVLLFGWREISPILLVAWEFGKCKLGRKGEWDGIRTLWPHGVRRLGVFCAVFSILLILISVGRIGALDFVTRPVRHFFPQGTTEVRQNITAPQNDVAPASVQSGQDSNLKSTGVKEWLNRSIWKPDPREPWSNDFWSPFDFPGMRPIEAAFALVGLAGVCLLTFRNAPVGLVLAWAGAVFLGLGYVRMTGYATLASGAVIIVCCRHLAQRMPSGISKAGWVVAALWIVFAWGAMLGGHGERLIPEGLHVSRFGKVPIYDDKVCDWVLEEFPNERVFTTIESGSYCLLRWGFRKQVFLDGFFSPHARSVWDAYQLALRSGELAVFYDEFQMTVAIIPSTSGPWMERFLKSPDWRPVAIGEGSVVFLHRAIPITGRTPRIFFTADDLRTTSAYFRYNILRNVFLITASNKPGGFESEAWLRDPAFEGFREMAKEVFPKL